MLKQRMYELSEESKSDGRRNWRIWAVKSSEDTCKSGVEGKAATDLSIREW